MWRICELLYYHEHNLISCYYVLMELENSIASETKTARKENTMKAIKTNYNPIISTYVELSKRGEGRWGMKIMNLIPNGIPVYKVEYMN